MVFIMPGGDHCAVFGCKNDRRHPERNILKDHINTLRFHSCKKKYCATWTRLLHRDGFKVTTTTKVCSNHFLHGQPFSDEPHPTLYMKGYNEVQTTPRRPPPQRSYMSTPRARPKTRTATHRSIGIQVDPSLFEDIVADDHNYCRPAFRNKLFSVEWVAHLEDEINKLTVNCDQLKSQYLQAKDTIAKLEAAIAIFNKKITVSDIANCDDLVKLYTGLPSYNLFKWLLAEVSPHAQSLHYYKGKLSADDKTWQINNTTKPGLKRSQSLEDQLLMTLMKLRLNLQEDDLAFRFGLRQSSVSQVLSTWIPLLAKELAAFIHWPSKEGTMKYYPACFHKYKGTVRCIIDCTEIQIDRPSLAASNSQVYSQYKSRPTLKCLVGITPSGTISYISKPTGGNTSDKKIVKMTNIVDKFEPGDICMADRGFNIQELFLHKQVRLVIPPFQRTTNSTSQFTESEDINTKTVANARIHVERAIGRLKEFQILQGPIPLNMIDLMESALVVCAALVNLQPILVPLSS
ncbi:PREDICTED: uncharacterized protein LOC106806841 [Priapulus caudatus]|uniref:Uncharacterized protein LOC106806841 n=1 Tax=Priapulus caudatus TaxID=37621 RepID=A0ABM1DWY2_PRICU|nr:PREDICTED: uncharacterized protein LOC106806841 [Priapulus caudatus]